MAASRFSRDVWLRSCIGTLRVRVCPLSRGGCLPHGRALAELVWVKHRCPVSGKDGDLDFNSPFLVSHVVWVDKFLRMSMPCPLTLWNREQHSWCPFRWREIPKKKDIHDFFRFSGDVGVKPPKLWRSHRFLRNRYVRYWALQRHAIFRLFLGVFFCRKPGGFHQKTTWLRFLVHHSHHG